MQARRGVSMIEIMVVVVLLGLCMIPLMNLGGSQHRQSFFTEHQLLAMGRARMVLDVAASFDYELFDALSKKQNDVPVDVELEKVFDGGLAQLYAETPGPSTASYAVKLDTIKHKLEFRRFDDASGMLTAKIIWTFATDRNKAEHSVELSRLIHRREVTASRRYALQ